MKRILLLGGTGDALRLARSLGPSHIYSLAGLGRVPVDLMCQVRVGGFGGAQGLAAFIAAECIDLLVDATHPYAAQISTNAASAAEQAGIPCWALRRPAWQAGEGDDWHEVSGWAELTEAMNDFRRPFFTLGREPLAHLHEIPAHQHWTVRCLDAQAPTERAEIIGDRGPFSLEAERQLFERLNSDVLISKNSGGDSTEPKLQVARERGLPVLFLRRPMLPAVTREFLRRDDLLTALMALGVLTGVSTG
ncbi:cobalt-precorrin-6A reductase [Pseudomonas stutzeri]|uniref:Cobalt-precorrin-6A reductase n=1 Tax=Stutzerimonas stutzeri TaxID=316 RepID=A0A2N8S0I5_STUST|nr:cobalt-precorrin-6A reductase [Stutzerimonas stutzeri]MCQ4297395.1 cobalt-precorrin-6A reductase [Stutzerimonas stutzeri]PNF80121.1 cobalt-precorrin-6A reductase [Stutzerimonas stutzeri]